MSSAVPAASEVGRGRRLADLAPFLVGALLTLAGAVASWYRLPPVARATVWAEDGRDFLGDRLADGPLVSILRPYEGYLHVVPRLIAELVVALVPVEDYALALTAASCLVVGATVALVFSCARSVVPAALPRLAIAAVPVLAPTAPVEVLGNTANLHWYLLWAAPWVLLSAPRTRLRSAVLAVVVLAIALTEIQVLLFAPLVLSAARQRGARPLCVALLLGVTVQLWSTLTAPRTENPTDPLGVVSIAIGFLLHPVAGVTQGTSEGVRAVVTELHWWPIATTVVVVLAAAVYVLVRGDRGERTMVVVSVVAAVVVWTAAVTLNPNDLFRYAGSFGERLSVFQLQRYATVPAMFLTAVVLLAAARLGREQRPLRWSGPLLVVVVVVVQLLQFAPAESRRGAGPVWSEGVEAAEEACADGARQELVATAPRRPARAEPWVVALTCDVLGDERPAS